MGGGVGGNMGQPTLEPHIYLSPSLGPCSLPSETPKSQVGSLLTCLSLSRRASESSLSSESSESSDAGEAQGCQGSLGGYLSLPTSLLIRLTSSPQPDGTPAASPCPLLVGHATAGIDWLSNGCWVGSSKGDEILLFKTRHRSPKPQPHLGGN